MENTGYANTAMGQIQGSIVSPTKDIPLTAEIADRMAWFNQSALESLKLLANTRDRLFGSAPPSTGNAQATTQSVGFAGTFSEANSQLTSLMLEVNFIAQQLSSRL